MSKKVAFTESTEARPGASRVAPSVTTLDNGLEIIVQEDHGAPVVAAQAWCKAGSINEGEKLGAGLSHVLEHMLFKGTTTRGAGRIDQEVQDAGGYMNAYTSFDHTVYLVNVPASGTRVAVDILCDIMQHATLPEEELKKEMQVILREMDMLQDDPARRSGKRLFQTAYTRSPYRYPIIGLPDIYHQISREDIFNYYRQKYCPNNVFFVVCGDVETGEIIDRIREAFAGTPARPLPPENLPVEPPQTAEREILEEAPIQLGYGHWAWHIPDLRHPDVPVLDVFSTVMGGGRSSRLYQRIREREALVHSIDAWTYNPGNPGLFGVSAMMDGDKFESVRSAITREIEEALQNGITDQELQKAIKQTVSATYSSRKTMQGQAQDLGHSWLAASDLGFSERFLERVKKTALDDLRRVAGKHLQLSNRTLFALLPEGTRPKTGVVSAAAVESPIQKIEFGNGLKLLLKEDHRLPFVQYRAVFRGGVLAETDENNGVSTLMTKMLLKGTSSRDAEQIALTVESLGGSIDAYSGNNSFGVNLETLGEDLETGLDLLADVVLHPAFPEANLERERVAQLAAIQAREDQLLQKTLRLMRREMFGKTGYGLNSLGSEESVSRLRRDDLARMHGQLAKPDNCVIAVYGDVDPEKTAKEVERLFGKWMKASSSTTEPPLPIQPGKPIQFTETTVKKQAVLVMGFPGTTLNGEDRHALELIQESCSDLGSRLFMRIRDELGLAYYVGAQNMLGLIPGYFAFYAGTAPEKADLVREEFLKEAQTLAREGLSEEELKRSKAKLLGQRAIARQELGYLAMTHALDELYGLGYENQFNEDARFEAVTLKEIQSAAEKYLRADRSVSVTIRPQ